MSSTKSMPSLCRRARSHPRSSRRSGSRRRTSRSSSSRRLPSFMPLTWLHVRTDDVAVVVLAAGEGRRLRPLTSIHPKPLCPVNNVPLIELAFGEVAACVGAIGPERMAVNAHHLADQIVAWVGDRAHISLEQPAALGTAGGGGHLRSWLDGRPLLIRNTDVWRGGPVPSSFVTDWDGAR